MTGPVRYAAPARASSSRFNGPVESLQVAWSASILPQRRDGRVMKRYFPGDQGEELMALNALADPVLAEIRGNDQDAAYDRV